MLWTILREMARLPEAPLAIDGAGPWPQRAVSLTPTGERLLAGVLDFLSLSPPERWVGGVRIAPGEPAWRWSAERGAPISA
jgi:hypothetical protein